MSPNVNYLYAPPLNMSQVRLRRERHFGRDDPLYHPQPFLLSTPHLALIITPQVDIQNKFYPAWIVPRNEHFVKRDTSSPRTDMGVVIEDFAKLLITMAESVLKNIHDDARTDKFVTEGAWGLQLELSRLEVPATLEQCLLRIRIIQRHVLELDARVRALTLNASDHEQDLVLLEK
ncbi:hypothetical protein BDP27DRAFT_1424242 [Rhodocollybia butyracea]|uniref:Uncharacterized protein n=1 Tax=Rhodocollybia butyracea TaxID=206335 RepID=A0A9P5PML5_9AGAR|nr:hypothetical protein BDP27DRAFT_1424242 [Rhodocollybia butyracea]